MTETTAPNDYTELSKAAADFMKWVEETTFVPAALSNLNGFIIALLDAHATVVAERDALREALIKHLGSATGVGYVNARKPYGVLNATLAATEPKE